MTKRVRVSVVTFIGFYLNSAADIRKYDDISVEEVRAEILAGTIFKFLQDRLGDDLDLSLFDEDTLSYISERWQEMTGINERRKFGITNRGLSLLVAYVLEMAQHPSAYGLDASER